MKKTIIIPEDWSEVKYKDYIKFVNSIKDQEHNDKIVLEMALQYLCNVDTITYNKLSKKIFNTVTTDMSKLLSKQTDSKLVKSFICDGVEYAINPDIENMSYGEYLDLTNYSRDIWNNMHIIASILYRPVKHKLNNKYVIQVYNGTDKDKISMFNELLTMDIVNGIIAFFLTLQQDLLIYSPIYLTKILEKDLTTQQLEILQKSGVDIKQLSQSLQEILPSLTK